MNTMKMKIFNRGGNFTSSKFFTILFAAFFTVLATSCLDDEPAPEPSPVAYVSLYHMSPVASSLSILVDNNRINSNAFSYTDYSGYLRFSPGERTLKFTPFNAANAIIESDIELLEDSIYSAFITGTMDDLELMVVNDKINFEDRENSLIRILHASPDAPAVKLVFSDEQQAIFDNLVYRSISEFEEISSDNATFEIRNADTDELISTVTNYDFAAENFYTIVVRGFVDPEDGNDNELNVQVIRN